MFATATLSAVRCPKSALFGERTLEALVVTLQAIWSAFHRTGRWKEVSEEGRYKIHQALGGMHALWSVMQIADKRRFKNRGEAVSMLCTMLSESGARYSFGRDICLLLSHLAGRRNAARECGDRIAAQCLDEAFWKLLGSGAFGALSSTSRNPLIPETALERYAAEVRSLWDRLESRSKDSQVNGAVRALCGQAMGLGIFEGVREQKRGRIADTADALKRWYSEADARRQRSFFACLGQSLDELGKLILQTEEALSKARGTVKRRNLREYLAVLKEGTVKIVMTGVLNLAA